MWAARWVAASTQNAPVTRAESVSASSSWEGLKVLETAEPDPWDSHLAGRPNQLIEDFTDVCEVVPPGSAVAHARQRRLSG
jgi:hypothetical protein